MQWGSRPTTADGVSPAASYTSHRQRALAAAFPTALAVVVTLTLIYAVAAILRSPGRGQILTYALELAVPLLALRLVRGRLVAHVEGVALGTDLCFTAVLAGRLLLPETTESGTALFLALKLLATAALFPWHPRFQYVSAGTTMLLYYSAVVLAGRPPDEIHQLAGPIIAAVLSCVAAAVADRTRRALWHQSVDLAAAEQRTRAVLEAERIAAAENKRLFDGLAASEARYRDLFERATEQEQETRQLLSQLREANRLQAEFVANMSHELRTPLNVIIGYGDLLADESSVPANSETRQFLARIAAAGRALHRLLESILEYARLDRGRTVLFTTRFPAVKLLGELRDLCGDVGAGSGVTVSIQDTSEIVFVSDYDRLYSILSNLLLNALKFTSAGTIELRVRQVGDEAEFSVRDTGIGIAADALAHVFEPFRQVDGSPTRIYGGVGLGLSIVQRNTELLRGRVEVESQVGMGSTFRVWLPIAVEGTQKAEAPTAA